MKFKVLFSFKDEEFEEMLEEFCKNKKIIDVKYQLVRIDMQGEGDEYINHALIMYHENENLI